MAKNKMPEREIPQIDGGWQGAASLPVYELMRRDRYTMAEIAQAFGCSLRTLYNRLDKQKAPASEQARGEFSQPSGPGQTRRSKNSKDTSVARP